MPSVWTLLDLLIIDKLVGNMGNHIKNLELLYTADLSECRLSPAYNLLSTLVYREHSNQMSVAIVGELRWDKISKASLICSHTEVGLSKAMIAEEYERLAEGLIQSVNEAVGELATEGFVDNFPPIGVWQSGVEWTYANLIAFRRIENDSYSFAER